jgi:hypothetical protein
MSMIGVPLNVLRGRRPTGLGFAYHFVTGSLKSLRYTLDKGKRLYVDPRS